MSHQPVLLAETIEYLNIQPDGCYIDGTFGRGGHSETILSQLSAQGRLVVFDRDPEAIAIAKARYGNDARVIIEHRPFSQMQEAIESQGFLGQVNGILLDLGVSSPQLDQAERGFSFMRDGPLDMRMDPTHGQSVAEWLLTVDEAELAQVLWRYGEEKQSRRIARAIVARQQTAPLTRTLALADLVSSVMPNKAKLGKHPATRTFQALRLFINQELAEVEAVLAQSLAILAPGGRLAVISFHSLEDRIVKQFIRQQVKGPEVPRHIPIRDEVLLAGKALRSICKMQKATEQEQQANVRSRSAILRVAEKR